MKTNLRNLMTFIDANEPEDIYLDYVCSYTEGFAHHHMKIKIPARRLRFLLTCSFYYDTLSFRWNELDLLSEIYKTYKSIADDENRVKSIDICENPFFRFNRILSYGSKEDEEIPFVYETKPWIESPAYLAMDDPYSNKKICGIQLFFMHRLTDILAKTEGRDEVKTLYFSPCHLFEFRLKSDVLRPMAERALDLISQNTKFNDETAFYETVIYPAIKYSWMYSEGLFQTCCEYSEVLKPWEKDCDYFSFGRVFNTTN